MAVRSIDITPDVSLLAKAGEVNYKIPQAVAELVDNAIDERVSGRKLLVEITTGQREGQKFISVVDNGGGMTDEKATKAMVMAHSTKHQGQIGKFGLGMKTACSNLGAHFEIVTATAEMEQAVRLVYDEEEFIRSGQWKLHMEEVPKPFDHGTTITISELKVNLYPGVKNTLLENFGRIFKHFVASGEVEIIVNADQVEPLSPETVDEYDTEIRFEVNGKLVRGWASLSPRGTGRARYGFDLIRGNRVMIQHERIGFPESSATSRIIGELHLDDFPVVNNKTDFRRDTEEWRAVEEQLKELLVDLVRESRRLANPGKFAPKDQAEVEEFVEDVQGALKTDDLQADLDRRALDAALADEFTDGPLPFTVPSDDGTLTPSDRDDVVDAGTSGSGSGPSERDEISMVDQHRLTRVKTQLRNIRIEHQIAGMGRDGLYKIWDVEGVQNRKKLVVTTNRDHPMYHAMEDSFMVWVKHNIVEAVAEYVTESIGRTEAMLRFKSDILKHIGKLRVEEIDESITWPTTEDEASTA